MVKRRRSRTDIITDILTTALNGKPKTHIMNQANLNYTQLRRYLPHLLQNNLLQTRRGEGWNVYKTTKKGREFLQKVKP